MTLGVWRYEQELATVTEV